jgi:hypothetical protein
MKFALLGADAESRALADAAISAGHSLAWKETASAEPGDNAWEALLDSETADAVLLGAGDADRRARQIMELAKLGRPVLAVHPIVPSVISYFEIDMARGESGAVLHHFNPLVESSLVERVVAWGREGHPALGAIEQIVATRMLGDRSTECVLWHFARDVELLSRIAGRFDRIGAHAALGDAAAAYASLGVQLLGARPIPVRWAVEPLTGQEELRVAVICQHGRAVLVFDHAGACQELIEQTSAGDTRTPAPAERPAALALGRFAAAVEPGAQPASTWTSALDAMELADSIEISLRRGRMIDVHHRELTEQLAFKGVMAAIGCGVLVVLIPLVIVVGWIAGILKIPLSDYWPHLLLAALAAFLALQLLPKLMSRQVSQRTAEERGADERHVAPADRADAENSTD